jgi:hypothetical protein
VHVSCLYPAGQNSKEWCSGFTSDRKSTRRTSYCDITTSIPPHISSYSLAGSRIIKPKTEATIKTSVSASAQEPFQRTTSHASIVSSSARLLPLHYGFAGSTKHTTQETSNIYPRNDTAPSLPSPLALAFLRKLRTCVIAAKHGKRIDQDARL